MRRLRCCKLVALVAFIWLAALALMPVAVSAQSRNDDVVSAVQSLASTTGTYWTDEKMRLAKPMPLPELGLQPQAQGQITTTASGRTGILANAGGPGETPQEQRIAGQADVEPLFSGGTSFAFTRYRLFPNTSTQYKTFPYKVIGKLFFTIPGQGNFVCSASSINSSNNSVVWTAGHCVNTPGVGFHTNFLFAPARFQGTNPFGIWIAKTVFTLNGWANSGLFEYDHGALVMNLGGNTSPKKKIGDRVGFLGFITDVSRLQHWHLHGYPKDPRDLASTPPGAQFDAEHHEICAASWGTNDQPGGNSADPQTIGVGCDQTGGTSGGPWLIDFSGVTGATNLLNGNNSYRYTGPNPPENLKLFSPYFTTGAVNLRNDAQAVSVP